VSREQCECLDSALPRPRTPVCKPYCTAVGCGFSCVYMTPFFLDSIIVYTAAQIVLIGYSRTQSKVSFGHRATTHSNSVLAPSVP
jgi:hypothetical protein